MTITSKYCTTRYKSNSFAT